MSSTSEEVISITSRAWARAETEAEPLPMTHAQLGGFLDLLLAAERAVQLDEARNCAVLLHLLLQEEVTPTPAVGDFYAGGWRSAAGASASNSSTAARPGWRGALPPEMLDSHVVNIGICERLL